jgi:two-component system phosphate regulon response regulator PhoB
VEDSPEIHSLVVHSLRGTADVVWSASIGEAREALTRVRPDLILLDVGLPDGSGMDFCAEVQGKKEVQEVPIFFLTANDQLSQKVLGFALGAEDFISKPFMPMELKARVEAKLKKEAQRKKVSDLLTWPGLEIDKGRQLVHIFVNKQAQRVELTSIEFKILLILASKPERVISREEILNDVWGAHVHVYPRSVDTHISKLRSKIGEASQYIQSVHGTGYKFVPLAVAI